jgi:hypothetical protein
MVTVEDGTVKRPSATSRLYDRPQWPNHMLKTAAVGRISARNVEAFLARHRAGKRNSGGHRKGWSGDGTMTLNLTFLYPEIDRAGMAVAPVPVMHLYDTIYQGTLHGTAAR